MFTLNIRSPMLEPRSLRSPRNWAPSNRSWTTCCPIRMARWTTWPSWRSWRAWPKWRMNTQICAKTSRKCSSCSGKWRIRSYASDVEWSKHSGYSRRKSKCERRLLIEKERLQLARRTLGSQFVVFEMISYFYIFFNRNIVPKTQNMWKHDASLT